MKHRDLLYWVLGILWAPISAFAVDFDYQLKPVEVAKDSYVFIGKTEDFSFANGGNIVNTAFVVTDEGVVVIDTGPSLRYGQQMRQAISEITDKEVVRVFITHHHPDHFLGNQAYKTQSILALKNTINNINTEGPGFTDNLYAMVGDWMRGTELVPPMSELTSGIIKLGGHEFELLHFSGHTSSDLVIFDRTTGVLFTGDVVFNKRTLTTPHADIQQWLSSIKELKKLPYKVLIPGHGPVSSDNTVLSDMEDYLQWLDARLKFAAKKGLSMVETMQLVLPDRFKSNALSQQEYFRSVTHLFTHYEAVAFKRLN